MGLYVLMNPSLLKAERATRRRVPVMAIRSLAGIFTLTFLIGTGCAHRPPAAESGPERTLAEVCSTGSSILEASGYVMMSAKSKEASGRFPATVLAQESPPLVKLEVTNLAGGTEALITVDGSAYRIEVPGKKDRNASGYGNWGGIPLHWARELFLGRVPCPEKQRSDLKITMPAPDQLAVELAADLSGSPERYVYQLKSVDGRPWAEALTWERSGAFARKVSFKFHEPEPKTRAARRWEASSSEGRVKLRWTDRRTKAKPSN